jgi:hypothetical protein
MPPRLSIARFVAFAVISIGLVPGVAFGADATIGLYTDPVGTSCSFSGNDSGLLTAYVVVRPGTSGISSVLFSAPTPSCFDATLVSEVVPSPFVSMGSLQAGITILSPNCEAAPFSALQVFYFAHGGTASCCDFSIVADPSTGLLEAFDCSNASTPISAITSHFNADASCECNSVLPPAPPSIPQPPDASTLRDINESLVWYSSDPSGRPMTADVYFGVNPVPPLVASNVPVQPYTTYWPGQFLLYDATYYWRIVLRNSGGAETSGPVWTFSTKLNHPPTVGNPTPANGAIQLPISQPFVLSWSANDPDGHALLFDVYFGTSPSPPRVSSGQPVRSFAAPNVQFSTTYYWYIVARDAFGMETTGPAWSFTIKAENDAPTVPSNPTPADGAVNIPLSTTLSWTSTDLEGEAVRYDVYFGIGEPLATVAADISQNGYSASGLSLLTTYYWRVVARDPNGLESTGPTWSFRTRPNSAPSEPSNPSPSNSGFNISITPDLSWACTDPEGQPLNFDVYLGAANPPPLVTSNHAARSYSPPALEFATTYYWQVVARDTYGATRTGDVWKFTTKPVNLPPNFPSNPSPDHNEENVDQNADLSWQCTDPEGQPLVFDVSLLTWPPGPQRYASDLTTPSWDPGMLLPNTIYRWYVIARDSVGGRTVGNLWYFTTSPIGNYPPTVPSNPFPLDGQITSKNPLLTWNSTDPDGQPLTFNISLGTTNPPPHVATTTSPAFLPGTLVVDARYFWQVTVSDGTWPPASGPVWSFIVSSDHVPVLFSRFDAEPSRGGVDVSWEFSSDETLDNYTLYRRDGNATLAKVITSNAVNGTLGSYMDTAVDGAKTYHYELLVRTRDGDEFRSTRASVTLPTRELTLYQNQPNPFNPQTSIRYDLPGSVTSRVRLVIVDTAGRRVRTLVDEDQGGGARTVVWNGRDDSGQTVSSGVYFYALEVGKDRLTRKLVLLK